MLYKIILNDVYPQCCGADLTADEAKVLLTKLRKESPNLDFRVFTMDGISVYW